MVTWLARGCLPGGNCGFLREGEDAGARGACCCVVRVEVSLPVVGGGGFAPSTN